MGKVIKLDFRPNKKQKLFFKAKTKYIAYGGARGGGKSWAMRTKAVLLCLRYKRLKVLLLRRTFPELEANHITPLLVILHDIAEYIVSKKEFRFPNGSVIKLGYCKNENDANQYQGQEYDVIMFEEATLFTESQLVFISTCLRNVRTDFDTRIYYTCNPGGPAHHYIKRLFIDREYEGDENAEEYTFIPALIFDNEILMKNDSSYIKVLDNLPEELRRAHRDGDWDALSGQYFREFRRSVHVIDDFDIPDSWVRYCTIDYGLDMMAALWIAVDPMGNCYVYREHHEPNLIISVAAEKIKYLSKGENIKAFYVPPDLSASRQETGKSALQIFIENGIVGLITKNSRISGWLCVKECLAWSKKADPVLKFFKSCKVAIKHIPLLQRDEKNPNDIAQEPHEFTHVADAIRYFCSTWITKTNIPEEEELSGTYFYPELRMKGYSDSEIRKLELSGVISVIS
jgi:phage terminase large subunit